MPPASPPRTPASMAASSPSAASTRTPASVAASSPSAASTPSAAEDKATAGDKVVVAVRLRPWIDPRTNTVVPADRANCCIRINESTCEIVEPRTGALRGQFTFDKCFDSFDPSDEASYADQERVFSELAPPLISGAMEGLNITVFAYGQTSSGKSHTMLGARDAPGFIPRYVEALFGAMADASRGKPGAECTLEASYLEIHMETIRDLLNPQSSKAGGQGGGGFGSGKKGGGGGLRVREHPRTGPYVEDLAKVACSSSDEVQMLLAHGNTVRTVCATQLNLESSRSHAIFTLKLTQREPIVDDQGGVARISERVSKIHLVDLAGSERAKRSGGHRLQETGAINKSLSTLGAVISALAAPGGKRQHVPYRESALTYLLKDGLGGNARTVMLAAISPTAADFAESLSTLRYADSAKRIVNHATPNLDASVKLVLQLKGEIEALRTQLASGGASAGGGLLEEDSPELAAIREQLRTSEKLMAEAQMSWEEKLRHAESLAEQRMGMVSQMEDQMAELAEKLALAERQREEADAERLRLAELAERLEAEQQQQQQQVLQQVQQQRRLLANGRRRKSREGQHEHEARDEEPSSYSRRGEEDWDEDEDGAGSEEQYDEDGDDDDDGADEMPPEFAFGVGGGRAKAAAATTPSGGRTPRRESYEDDEEVAAVVVASPRQSLSVPPQPSAIWYSLLDDEGDEYYWNPSTGETTWHLPDEALVLPAAPGGVVANNNGASPAGAGGAAPPALGSGASLDGATGDGDDGEAREREAAAAVARALAAAAGGGSPPPSSELVIAQGESEEEEEKDEDTMEEAEDDEIDGRDEMPAEFRTVTTTRRLTSPSKSVIADYFGADAPARRSSEQGVGQGGSGGGGNGMRTSIGGMAAEEEFDGLDGHMLGRTLAQLTSQQRTLASLKVQLAQAEQMRDAQEQQLARGRADQEGPIRKSKWTRNATTLRAAVVMLSPMPEWMRPRPCAHMQIESCLADGWLLRKGGEVKGGRAASWRRAWHCLRAGGLLTFDDASDEVPRGFIGIDASAKVETHGADIPPQGFRLATSHATLTFLCDSRGGGQAASDEWAQAIELVIRAASRRDSMTYM